jgi:hypothetical protein
LAIVIVNICGYMVNTALYRLIYGVLCPGCYTSLLGWQLSFIAGILMNIAAASNAPILYFTRLGTIQKDLKIILLFSTDYREAYHRRFPILSKLKKSTQNHVSPSNHGPGRIVIISTSIQRES